MLKVKTEILEDWQAKLTVEVEPERTEREMKAAAQRIARRVNIPGFRPGRAPYRVIASQFGESTIFQEAVEPLSQEIYREALEQSKIEPYAAGSLEGFERDPLTVTFIVPLNPKVEIRETYRDIRLPFQPHEVTNDDVTAALEEMQRQQAILEPVERPLGMGDMGTFDIRGVVEDNEDQGHTILFDDRGEQLYIDEKTSYPLKGFAQQVVGMAAGDTRSFDLVIEDDAFDQEMQGRTVHFEITCTQVHEYTLPEVDDEFAQSVGEYDNLLELRAHIRQQLERSALRIAREEYSERALEHLVAEEATVHFPPLMLEEEIDALVKNFEQMLRQRRLTLEDYLRISNISQESFRDDFRETASSRLRKALVLAKLVDIEQLAASEEEVDDEIQTIMLNFGEQSGLAKQFFDSPASRRSIATQLLTQKALDRLVDIARGEAPSLSEAQGAEVETPDSLGNDAENATEQPSSEDDQR